MPINLPVSAGNKFMYLKSLEDSHIANYSKAEYLRKKDEVKSFKTISQLILWCKIC